LLKKTKVFSISEISLCHSFNCIPLLLFEFAHSFNEAVVVALDDVLEIGLSVFNKQHVKQEPE